MEDFKPCPKCGSKMKVNKSSNFKDLIYQCKVCKHWRFILQFEKDFLNSKNIGEND